MWADKVILIGPFAPKNSVVKSQICWTCKTRCSSAQPVAGVISSDQVKGVVGQVGAAEEGGRSILKAVVMRAGQGGTAQRRPKVGEVVQAQAHGTVARVHQTS